MQYSHHPQSNHPAIPIFAQLCLCFSAIFFLTTCIQSQSFTSKSYPSLPAIALNFPSMYPQSGSELKCKPLIYEMISQNSKGRPQQRVGISIVSFFYIILSYFYFLPWPFIDCHGRLPRRKYKRTYMRDYRSSLLPCQIPRWVLIDAYLAVPVRSLLSLYAICSFSFPKNRLANPKSIIYIFPMFCLLPIKKLSGLRSRCNTPLEWTNLINFSISRPIIMVVLSVKCRSQRFNRSSREFPSRSMTITQQFPSLPMLKTLGMLISYPISLDFARSMMNLDYNRSCDLLTLALSIFRATSDPSLTFLPRQISPNAPSPNFLTISQKPRTRLGLSWLPELNIIILIQV